MHTVRWGILGTGGIARKFAEALSLLPDAKLTAVGSRTRAAADAFGDEWKIPRRYGSYKELALDPETDVVYVATIHPLHYENCIDCLTAGKAVLNEKPFTINAPQAKEVIELARRKKSFLMEAMWTRYFPVFGKLRELLAEKAVGEILLVQADFAFQPKYDPKGRLYNRELGGGALMDIGIYPVSLASMIFGEPPGRILSSVKLGSTGVDEQAAMVFEYSGGRQASLTFSFRYESPQEVNIIGTEGRIRIERPWWYPQAITLARRGRDAEKFSLPYRGNGYVHEAVEVMECLRAGRTESAHMPLDETLQIMQTLDAIRSDWGLKYPGD